MPSSSNIPIATPRGRGRARLVQGLLVVTALIGIIICAVLLDMSIGGADRSATSVFCKPTATINCGHVLASRWATIGYFPTAQLGLIYFACILGWYALIGLPNRAGRAWQLVPIFVIGSGLLGSGGFLFIMSRLPVWCTWCAAAHVANLVLFLLSIVAWFVAANDKEAKPTGSRVGAVVGVLILIGLTFLLGSTAYRQQQVALQFQKHYLEIVNDVDYIVWRHASSPRVEIPIRDDDLRIGRDDAPHTLVIFSDFECDECATLHKESNIFGLAQLFPDSLRVVFRHYPVCRSCNKHVDRDFHFYSCDAAMAAEAAHRLGDREATLRYWRLLYQNRERFDENPYAYLAKEASLNVSEFESARRSDAVRRRVEADIDLAHSLGVEGTPTLFLDGRRLMNWRVGPGGPAGQDIKKATLRLWQTLLRDDETQNPRD